MACAQVVVHSTLAFAENSQPTGVDQIVRSIIESTEQAQTLEELHAVSPHIFLLKDHLFSARPTADPQIVCDALNRIAAKDLLIFYDEIGRIDSTFPLACRNNLVKRMRSYFLEKQQLLSVTRAKLTPCRSENARVPTMILGPSTAMELDNARAKTVVDAGLPECHVNLTFDDGPHGTLTTQLLTILAQEKVQANFFVLGKNVKLYQDITVATAHSGHVVGNHTMTHANLPKLDVAAAKNEITLGFNVLLELFGEYMPFFRFPYGASTKTLKTYAYDNRWLDFFWNMDTLDWKLRDPEELYRNVLVEIEREKKGVILFHDVHPQTIAVIPYVLSALNEAGYTSVVFTPKEVAKNVPNQIAQ